MPLPPSLLLRQAHRHLLHQPPTTTSLRLLTGKPTTTVHPLAKPTTLLLSRKCLSRPASTTSSSAAQQIRSQKSHTQLYPPSINVYRSGTPALLTIGLTRLSTIVIALVGTTIYAPGFYFSPEHSNWLIPACVILSATPMLCVSLLTGPMIHGIKITLPERVRRGGKEGLKRWSESKGGEGRDKGRMMVELQFMRWSPWPRSRIVEFGELRRLKPSLSGGIANLQHVPPPTDNNEVEFRGKHKVMDGFMKRWMARFYVKRDQKVDRAAVPGVWEGLWHQIPYDGEEDGAGLKEKEMSGKEKEVLRPVVPPMGTVGRP